MTAPTNVTESLAPSEKFLSPEHRPNTLTHTYSSGSTLQDAIDAEANITAVTSGGLQKSKSPGPPPDGGAYAWLQVLGSFFLFFNSWYV
jgi:hypothetical protein